MIASVTERGTFKTCRWMWDKQSLSRQGMEHPLPAKALLLGSLIHYTLADWISWYGEQQAKGLDQAGAFDPISCFMGHFQNVEKEIRRRYEKRVGLPMDDDEFEKMYGPEVRDLGRTMIDNYVDYYETPIPKGYTVVGVEQTVTMDVPGTEHCTCSAPCSCFPCSSVVERYGTCHNACGAWFKETGELCPCMETAECHKIEATFDAAVADPKGRILIVDHKTYEKKPYKPELDMNDQFLAYTWIANKLGLGPVIGVLYNGLWKRTWEDLMKPPTKKEPDRKEPRNKNDGTPYTRDDLFFRTFILHNREELDEFSERLPVELNEMGRPDVPIYMNRAWYSCMNCSVRQLCYGTSRGEDVESEWAEFVPRERTPAWRQEI